MSAHRARGAQDSGAQLAQLDEWGVRAIRGMPHPPAVNRALAALSRLTDHSDGWLVLGLAGAIWRAGGRERWLSATGRIATIELVSQGVKRAVPRDRPQLDGLPPLASTPSPRSFPSSHTAAAVAAVTTFDGLLPRWALRALAATTAFSRLYLGVHYPSDVLAGAVLGRLLGECEPSGGHRRARQVTHPRLDGRSG